MSEWRPANWENPSTEESLEAHGWRLDKTTLRWLKPDGDGHDLIPYDVSVERRYAYEAGADAIVAALKEQSTRVDTGVEKGTINLPFHGGSHGFVVFIPDKE